jgi:DNA (cytosine-5)-methyltransferase 1
VKLGSLFDGIGGFPLSAIQHGIEPVWASEIEPFPILVTKKHFPNMKHLGDITKINGAEIEPVEIITGGSPCQDLSVAGKRAGLAGERSGLFMEQVRIVKEMREHDRTTGRSTESIRPRYMVWENVPGAFSSNGGEDFRAVLEETARIADETVTIPRPRDDKWDTAGAIVGRNFSIAWRVLDAQYWGVPQRRRRIFLVADFAGHSAGEILFKCESVSGHSSESEEKGQTTTGGIGTGVESTITFREVAGTLRANAGAPKHEADWEQLVCQGVSGDIAESRKAREEVAANTERSVDETSDCLTPWDVQSRRIHKASGKWPALYGGEGGGHGYAAIPETIVYGIQGSMIGRADKNGPQGDGINEDVSFTLNTTDRHAVAYGVVSKGNGEAWITPERHMALNTGGGQAGQGYPAILTQEPKVCGICSDGSNSMKSDNPHSGIYEADTSRTIDQNGGNPACNQGGMAIVQKLYESHPNDSRVTGPVDVAPTISQRYGTGGNNTPLVQTFSMQRFDQYKESEQSSSLKQRDYKDSTDLVVNAEQIPTYSAITGQQMYCWKEMANPLKARDYKDAPIVNRGYTVRRLTPTECERLQGYPDGWTEIPGTTEVSKEELEFWRGVWYEWDKMQSEEPEEVNPRTDKAILRWLKNPTSDTARYKALGNSVAVPCVTWIMGQIVNELRRNAQDD